MMTLDSTSRRPRPAGGLARPDNRSHNKSPAITCCLPPDIFERMADEAAARGVPMARLVREALRIKYPEGDSP